MHYDMQQALPIQHHLRCMARICRFLWHQFRQLKTRTAICIVHLEGRWLSTSNKMSKSATAGYAFNASHQDVIFVNGGLQPAIRMAPGIPQLWRIVNAAWKVRQLLFVFFFLSCQIFV